MLVEPVNADYSCNMQTDYCICLVLDLFFLSLQKSKSTSKSKNDRGGKKTTLYVKPSLN